MKFSEDTQRRLPNICIALGAVVLLICGALFCYKHFTGYTKVTKVGTFSGCTINTRADIVTGRGSTTVYWLDVTCESEGLHFHRDVKKHCYDMFLRYHSEYVTFYKDENRRIFPTYVINCDEREAEREYRHINPPLQWYLLYSVLGLIGLCFCALPLLEMLEARFPGFYDSLKRFFNG